MVIKIGLSTIVYDSDGARLIKQDPAQDQDNINFDRRSTVTPTLDGEAVLDDSGFSESDRTYIVKARLDSEDLLTWASRVVKNYSQVGLACKDGYFVCNPKQLWTRDGFLYIKLLIISKESE